MTYLRYSDDIETIQPDEQKSIDGIIQGMSQQTETVEKRADHAVRVSYAESSAGVTGELTWGQENQCAGALAGRLQERRLQPSAERQQGAARGRYRNF